MHITNITPSLHQIKVSYNRERVTISVNNIDMYLAMYELVVKCVPRYV